MTAMRLPLVPMCMDLSTVFVMLDTMEMGEIVPIWMNVIFLHTNVIQQRHAPTQMDRTLVRAIEAISETG